MELPREYYEADLETLKSHLDTLIKNNEICQLCLEDNNASVVECEAEIDACGTDPYYTLLIESIRKNIKHLQRDSVLLNNNIALHKMMIENDRAKITILEKVFNG